MTPAPDRSSSSEGRLSDGELAAAISKTVVQALARTTGRGPTKARPRSATTASSSCSRTASRAASRHSRTPARAQAVLDLRRRWQGVMQADVSREIEELTGRKVIGFMSDNHIDPDLAVEVFVLEPLPGAGVG